MAPGGIGVLRCEEIRGSSGSPGQEGRSSPASAPVCFWLFIQVSRFRARNFVRLWDLKVRACPQGPHRLEGRYLPFITCLLRAQHCAGCFMYVCARNSNTVMSSSQAVSAKGYGHIEEEGSVLAGDGE